jgi:hypothetical protein
MYARGSQTLPIPHNVVLFIFMADFDLFIDECGFKKIGVKPIFNEDLYCDLLNEFTTTNAQACIALRPHMSWGLSPREKFLTRLQHPYKYTDYGEYHKNKLDIVCVEDLEETNNTLLHETKHFIDDYSVVTQERKTVKERILNIGVGVVIAADIVTFVEFRGNTDADIAVICGGLVLSAIGLYRYYGYTNTPYEIEARYFADNAKILEAYGHIISYQQY